MPGDEPLPTHHIAETRTTDYEKMLSALQPMLEPAIKAFKEAQSDQIREVERGNTRRAAIGAATTVLVAATVCGLAFACILNGQAPIAEKIVIGLLAFIGGFAARR